jgi:hypothetical protein
VLQRCAACGMTWRSRCGESTVPMFRRALRDARCFLHDLSGGSRPDYRPPPPATVPASSGTGHWLLRTTRNAPTPETGGVHEKWCIRKRVTLAGTRRSRFLRDARGRFFDERLLSRGCRVVTADGTSASPAPCGLPPSSTHHSTIPPFHHSSPAALRLRSSSATLCLRVEPTAREHTHPATSPPHRSNAAPLTAYCPRRTPLIPPAPSKTAQSPPRVPSQSRALSPLLPRSRA